MGATVELGTNNWSFSLQDGGGTEEVFLSPACESFAGLVFHCTAVTIDRGANVASSYIDGTPSVSQPTATLGPFAAGSPTLRFGTSAAGFAPFGGVLDEVRLYSRALDAAAIFALHHP